MVTKLQTKTTKHEVTSKMTTIQKDYRCCFEGNKFTFSKINALFSAFFHKFKLTLRSFWSEFDAPKSQYSSLIDCSERGGTLTH